MRIALIQFNAGPDKTSNLRRAAGMAAEALANRAEFVLFPEVFTWRGNTRDALALRQAAESIPGPTSRLFCDLAGRHKSCILLGSILENGARGMVRNTSVFIDTHGGIAGKYRKIHLFDARIGDKIIREKDCFTAGRTGVIVRAGDFDVGLSICYDLRFPELYCRYGRKGVQVLAVPSCFTRTTGEAHWESLLRARAIEQLSYVLAPAQVGPDARGVEAYGNSMIVSPWGEVLARGSRDREEILYGDLDPEAVRRARQMLPGIAGQFE